jgi:UDPglucose 6-dehydrogenase
METKKIGFVGLGKLGLPCALSWEQKAGFDVVGYDPNPEIRKYLSERSVPYMEAGMEAYLKKTRISVLDDVSQLVKTADYIFVAVQTPHDENYEGVTPTPSTRRDFDYSYLLSVAHELGAALKENPDRNPLIVVISTVLPGTMREVFLPALMSYRSSVRFAYNPYFIAMGTTINDFENPEYLLIGTDSLEIGNELSNLYSKVHSASTKIMNIESAELTKVAYNTFIGFKIVFANTLAEIVDARGGNVDEITDALAAANVRLMSPKYLKAGMGDGGGCHPRDQIAMSWLAEEANLSFDIFGTLALARDSQTARQARTIIMSAKKHNLPICILGWSYKPETNLIVGSPARLLGSFLESEGMEYQVFDPWVYPEKLIPRTPHVFFIATNHYEFSDINIPHGSIVIDPWGIFVAKNEIEVQTPGRSNPPLDKI